MTTSPSPASDGRASSDAERIARRYPVRRTPRWLWIPLAALLAALGGTWLVWAAWYGSHPAAIGHVAGFRIVSDSQIDVQVTVQRANVRDRVQCQVKATAVSYDTVGQLPFTWEPNGEELQTGWVSVRTFKPATTAEMDYCRVVP